MRDPLNWALPLFRIFGIAVRLHVLFPVITLGLFLRLYYDTGNTFSGGDLFAFIVVIPFVLILLHEFGHCFAARSVGGSADQILMWPLGGLAFVNVPETPRAHAITTIWGPLVNLIICLGCSAAFLAGGFSPLGAFNPVANPFTTHISSFDGRTFTSHYETIYYPVGSTVAVAPASLERRSDGSIMVKGTDRVVTLAQAPGWVVWTWRVCWMSWWLFLFNMLIPAYPMDCGRLLHAFLWQRTDHRTASITCGYVGYGTAFVMMIVGIATNESILLMLAMFIIIECYRVLNSEMSEAGAFGYDFSQGYTSLDRDEPPAVKPRKQGMFKRWLMARQVRKLKSEHDERVADDARMDELLEKIARNGKQSLTEEEHRFMVRFSDRYRNRS